jgi:hypothetical protein
MESDRRLEPGNGRAAGDLDVAAGLWRGMPLQNVPSALLRDREVPGLLEQRVQIVESRLEAGLRLGHTFDAIAELRRLEKEHPLREHLNALLMTALDGCGRRADALEVFRDLRAALHAELGGKPVRTFRTCTGPSSVPAPPGGP